MAISQMQIDKIVQIAKTYGITRLIMFGSGVEMPEKARDIDIACDGIKGWEFYEFAAKVEDELEMPLDIVSLYPPTRFTRYIETKGRILL